MSDNHDHDSLVVEVKRAIARTLRTPVGTAPGSYDSALARAFPIAGYKPGDVPPMWNGASPGGWAPVGAVASGDQAVLVEVVQRATAGARSALDRLDALGLGKEASLRRDRIRSGLDGLDREVARPGGPRPQVVDPLLADIADALAGDPLAVAAAAPGLPDPADMSFADLIDCSCCALPPPVAREERAVVIRLLENAGVNAEDAWNAYNPFAPGAAAYDRARLIVAGLLGEKAQGARDRFAELAGGDATSDTHYLPGSHQAATVDGFFDAVDELSAYVPSVLSTLGYEAVPGIVRRAAELRQLAADAADAMHDPRLSADLDDIAAALGELQNPTPSPVLGDAVIIPDPDDRTAAAVEDISLSVADLPGGECDNPLYVQACQQEAEAE
jgi:hypothetical protein